MSVKRPFQLLLLTFVVLLSFGLACGDDEGEPDGGEVAEEAEAELTPQELAEANTPTAVETAEKLLTAIQNADEDEVIELCFRDISSVSEDLGLSDSEIAESRAQQELQRMAFDEFWQVNILSGAYMIESWTTPVAAQIAPAEGHPELIVYLLQADIDYTLNGESGTDMEKVIPVFNLGDAWYSQWIY